MTINREGLYQQFRNGQIEINHGDAMIQRVLLDKVARTADGWFLAADINNMLAALLQKHEYIDASDEPRVLALRPEEGTSCYQLRMFAVRTDANEQGNFRNKRDGASAVSTAAPSPAPGMENFPAERSQDASVKIAKSSAAGGQQLSIDDVSQTPLDQIRMDKDTHLARKILVDWRDQKIRTIQDFDKCIARAHDPDRVRRLLVNCTPDMHPTKTRSGEVRWDDVDGVRGQVPFGFPIMASGHVKSFDSKKQSSVTFRLIDVEMPEGMAVPPFPVDPDTAIEMRYTSVDVGRRLHLFHACGLLRVKLTVRTHLIPGVSYSVTVSELYPEELDDQKREELFAWAQREIWRMPPDEPGWERAASRK